MDEYLNIDEVVFGHPKAQQELDDLRAEVERLRAFQGAIALAPVEYEGYSYITVQIDPDVWRRARAVNGGNDVQ